MSVNTELLVCAQLIKPRLQLFEVALKCFCIIDIVPTLVCVFFIKESVECWETDCELT